MTKEQMEAFQSRWIEVSTSWEQGAEGPAATDRGSFKCGFFDGIRYAESEQLQKMQELENKLTIAVEALEKVKLHGCCVMHNDTGCPSCTAHDALAKIRGVE